MRGWPAQARRYLGLPLPEMELPLLPENSYPQSREGSMMVSSKECQDKGAPSCGSAIYCPETQQSGQSGRDSQARSPYACLCPCRPRYWALLSPTMCVLVCTSWKGRLTPPSVVFFPTLRFLAYIYFSLALVSNPHLSIPVSPPQMK